MNPAIEPVDELAIRAVLIRYATAIDTKDWQLFRACFTEDCCARFGGLVWHAVDVLVDVFEKAHAPLDDSIHRVLNIAVIWHDRDAATSRSYCDAILVRHAATGGAILHVHGVYSNAVRRDGGVWRIANRHFAPSPTGVHSASWGSSPSRSRSSTGMQCMTSDTYIAPTRPRRADHARRRLMTSLAVHPPRSRSYADLDRREPLLRRRVTLAELPWSPPSRF
jgi:hypothetical protein